MSGTLSAHSQKVPAHKATVANSRQSKLTLAKLNFAWHKATPTVLQSEASECGLACLSMIANHHGNNISLRALRNAMPASQQGMNLQELIKSACKLNLSSRAVKLELNELSQLQLPAILHWNFKHFVVLTKVSRQSVCIIDPALGKQTLSLDKVGQQFTGVALELAPTDDFVSAKAKGQLSLWAFTKNKVGIKRHLLTVLGLSLFIQLFVLATPFYMQTVIDNVLVSNNYHLLSILAIGFGLLLVFETVTQWLRDMIMLRFSHTFNLSISSGVFAHLLSLPTTFFQRRHIGDIVSRFGSLQKVRDILTQGLISAFIDGLLGIITLAVMFIYSVKLALIVLAVVVIYSLLRWALFFPIKQLSQQVLHSDAAQQSFFMQSVRAITTIKLSKSNEKTHASWLNKFVDNANQRIALGKWNIHFSIINKVLFGLENLFVVYVAAQLVMLNTFSIGMLFAFMSYKGRFVGSAASIIDKWIEFKLLSVHLSRIEDILFSDSETPPAIAEKLANSGQGAMLKAHTEHSAYVNKGAETDIVHPNSHRSAHGISAMAKPLQNQTLGATLRIEAVSYQYHDNQAFVFENLNLAVEKGAFIAVAGKSGCGKTSLLNCLLGLVVPTAGKLFIDGQLLVPSNRESFCMAAVMQHDQLLNGSVIDNISSFDESIDLQRAIHAARMACVHTDIMAMTMQYETLIGDMGSSLSGGQKQRIILARAIYQEPQLLVLDEATSHLDIPTEAQICKHLKALPITIIMVAHRPQALTAADKIYTLSPHGLTESSYPSDQSTSLHDPSLVS
jgi:ATP-binding cassette subfamily B protein RaxB